MRDLVVGWHCCWKTVMLVVGWLCCQFTLPLVGHAVSRLLVGLVAGKFSCWLVLLLVDIAVDSHRIFTHFGSAKTCSLPILSLLRSAHCLLSPGGLCRYPALLRGI